MVPGSSWLTTGGGGEWLFLWPGFCRPSQAPSPESEKQLTAFAECPDPLSRQEVLLLQLLWLEPVPMGTTVSLQSMLPAAWLLRWAEQTEGSFSSISLRCYFSACSVAGCPGGKGRCRQWAKTGVLPLEEKNYCFQTHFLPVLSIRGIQRPSHQLAKCLTVGVLPLQVAFKRFTKSKKM